MLNKIYQSRLILPGLQILTLLVFLLIIAGAFGITTDDKSFASILRNTNFSNLIVWSYWWPLIIVSAILFGRIWCSICPMELVTSFFGRVGLKRKPGKLLKSGWIVTLFYGIILVLGIHTYAIHRIPHYMSLYMLILFVVAIIAGIYWEKRTFCTYLCPIGHLLGFYSLLSFKSLRVKEESVCASCKTKDCISKVSHYKFIGRSCTSELYPAKLIDNRDCILCGQCHKSCSKDNIAIKTNSFASGLFTPATVNWAQISFMVVVSGFVIYEIFVEWSVTKEIIMSGPKLINDMLNVTGKASGTVKALLLFVFIPFIFYLLLAASRKVISKESLKQIFTQLIIAILPITAFTHLVKALYKTTSRFPYWKYVFSDPIGEQTAGLIRSGDLLISKENVMLMADWITIFAILLTSGAWILSLFIIKKQHIDSLWSRSVSILAVSIYAAIFLSAFVARLMA
jgi:polyferredoxin